MLAHWLLQSGVLVLLISLLYHTVEGQLECNSRLAGGAAACPNQVNQVCRDEVSPPVCPPVASLNIDTDLAIGPGLGCSDNNYSDTPVPGILTSPDLSLIPVTHNCAQYNLTVSWTSNTTIPKDSTFDLRLFDKSSSRYRRICSSTKQLVDGPPIRFRQNSFDGLSFDQTFSFVQLIVVRPNHSEPLVIQTSVPEPGPYQHTPYRCLDDEQRYSAVTNVSHNLTCGEEDCRVMLSWEQPAPMETYGFPFTYFVKVFNNRSDSFITAFSTDQTQMVIYHLNYTREYFIRVEPFLPCSARCGNSTLNTILTVPSSAPEVVNVSALSSSTIQVVWKPILEEWNGIIVKYEVQYHAVNESKLLVSTPNLSFLLSALSASTEYVVRVRAITSVGAGPFSPAVYNTTLPEDTTTDPPVYTTTLPEDTDYTKIVASSLAAGVFLVVATVIVVLCIVVSILIIKRRQRDEPGFSNINPVFVDTTTSSQPYDCSLSVSIPSIVLQNELQSDDSTSSCSVNLSSPTPPYSSPPSSREVEALVVVSERCKNEQLLETLYSITMYNHNNTRINLTFMGDEINQGKIASDILNCAQKRSKELFLLLVVNKEFLEEWEGTAAINNSLVFCVQWDLKGKLNHLHTQDLERVVVLWEETNYTKHLPPNLKACKSFCIDDDKNISRFIAGQAEYCIA